MKYMYILYMHTYSYIYNICLLLNFKGSFQILIFLKMAVEPSAVHITVTFYKVFVFLRALIWVHLTWFDCFY